MALIKTWTFQSNSNPSKTYETSQYDDRPLSCQCKGWTFAKNGIRSCTHTRKVEQGIADREALSVWEASLAREPAQRTRVAPAVERQNRNTEKLSRIRERLAQEKKEKLEAAAPTRKVNWQRIPA